MSDLRPLATSPEVANFLRIPPRTLDTWARNASGPRFSRVGKHRRYRWADVEAWLNEQAKAAA